MYYLRTQAAAAPIQFTVDQEALRVADNNVGKDRPLLKKRSPPSGSYVSSLAATPLSGFVKREEAPGTSLSGPNGIPTPSTTPPPKMTVNIRNVPVASSGQSVMMKSVVEEGDRPNTLPTQPTEQANAVSLPEPSLDDMKNSQSENKDEETQEGELDIYSEAVLACEFNRRFWREC
jgi:ribonucleoside-diphosphate reductase subunit M1